MELSERFCDPVKKKICIHRKLKAYLLRQTCGETVVYLESCHCSQANGTEAYRAVVSTFKRLKEFVNFLPVTFSRRFDLCNLTCSVKDSLPEIIDYCRNTPSRYLYMLLRQGIIAICKVYKVTHGTIAEFYNCGNIIRRCHY